MKFRGVGGGGGMMTIKTITDMEIMVIISFLFVCLNKKKGRMENMTWRREGTQRGSGVFYIERDIKNYI